MKDQAILAALLNSEKLSDDEERAFRSMLSFIDSPERRNPRMLTARQRAWAESVYKRLHLDDEEPSQNLYSTGAVPPPTKPLQPMGWEKFPRPLKPPNRNRPS